VKNEDSPKQSYLLRIAYTAEKDLKDLQPKQYKQVASKIFSLIRNPKPHDCKVLKREPDGYRVDQGEFRILYYVYEDQKIVDVYRVGKRNDDEVYRNL
jgi:mRNA interferase RelE/StbE